MHSLPTQKHVTDHHQKLDTEVLVEPWHAEQLENFVLTVSTVVGNKVTETVFTKQLLRTTRGEKNIHSGPRELSTAPLLTGQDSKQRETLLCGAQGRLYCVEPGADFTVWSLRLTLLSVEPKADFTAWSLGQTLLCGA